MTTETPSRVRYLVLAALAAGAILAYLLRVSISPAGTTIQNDLGLNSIAMGDVFAAFFVGYFWFQIPGGWFGGKVGARVAMGVMGLLWSLAIVVSSQARGASGLYWSRVALGVGQAGLFPVTIVAIRDWFPRHRHGFASAVITACMSVGAVAASALTTRLLGVLGWRTTFLVYGAATTAWAILFVIWFRDTPASHPAVNQAERELIGGQEKPHPGAAPARITSVLGAFLLSPPMWALCAQTFFQAFAYAVFITWFPAYLEKGRGVSVTRAGDLTMLPLGTVVVGSLLGGVLIDRVLRRGGRRWLSRSGLPGAGLALAAVSSVAATTLREPGLAVAMIALGMFFTGAAMPGKWACTIDLTGPQSATGLAYMNMAGNIGAWACPKIVGHLFAGLEQGHGDWNSFLLLLGAIQAAAAVSCWLLNPYRPAIATPS